MKKRSNYIFSTIFLAPGTAIYVIFVIIPILMTVYYTTVKWNGVGAKVFNNFHNYVQLVQDPGYWKTASNNLKLILMALVFQLPVGLVLAYLVSGVKKGYKFFRAVFFLPVILSAAVTGVMFFILLNDKIGPVNMVLDALGLQSLKQLWLSDKNVVLYSVAIPQLWQYIGTDFVIFLAAIQSIPEEVMESARLDGVSGTGMLFKIVIPMITEFIHILIVLTVTGCLKAFEHAYIMTTGGPGVASSYLAIYMYRKGFVESSFSYASTIALSILIFSVVFTVAFKKYFSKEAA